MSLLQCSTFKEQNEAKWTPAPLESLLNVDKLIEFWKGHGLTVHRVRFQTSNGPC